MTSQIPAFTVLDDGFNNESNLQPPKQAWQSMYDSNILSAPPNSPFSGYEVSKPDDSNYESLTNATNPVPRIPESYNQGLIDNSSQLSRNLRYNLPATPPIPLQSHINLPSFNPPYGTPYSSSKFSPYDGELSMQAGVRSFYALPGVPVSSQQALQDARDSPAVQMSPQTITMIADNHFREGFKQGRERYESNVNCPECMSHISSCPVCNNYINSHKSIYLLIIGFLSFIILILLFILYKKQKA